MLWNPPVGCIKLNGVLVRVRITLIRYHQVYNSSRSLYMINAAAEMVKRITSFIATRDAFAGITKSATSNYDNRDRSPLRT